MNINHGDYQRLQEELRIAIEARREADRLLEQSELRYKALMQHAADAMYAFDFKGNLLEVNNQACNSLGYSTEELLQMNLADIVPGFDPTYPCPLWAKGELDRPLSMVVTQRRKDGSTFPAEVRLTLVDYGGERLTLAVVRDISERRRQEHALQESVAFNESLLQTMTVPVFYKDARGVYTGCNNAFAEFIGKSKSEIIGKTVFEISPQTLSTVYRDKDLELLEAPVGVQIYESRVNHADGTLHEVVFHKARIVKANGEAIGIIGVIVDITERKRAEKMQVDLIHQLEEKELAKTRFLASAGHDLRQPVAAASLFVHTLKLTEPTAEQAALIDKLDESMKTFSGLLDQLLNISRFDAGLVRVEPSLFSLGDMFSWLSHNFAKPAMDKGLSFRFYLPMTRSLVLDTDVSLLKSVLMNLLSNAIKFTVQGGVLVSARVHGGKILFQVWDTGIGIAQENRLHIFDEFYQINNPQRDRNSGLGLGLSIVKRALSLLGSEIECRSRVGRGTVFSFYLPLESSVSNAPQHTAGDVLLEDLLDYNFMKNKRFVVVEDDALVAEGMTSWLEGMGGRVQLYNSAVEALESAQIGEADYYIADYMLGGEYNGIQFLQQLRQKLDRPVNAVLVTGDTSPTFVHAVEQCDWPVLHKPIQTSKLISSLRSQQAEASRVNRLTA